MITRIPVKDYNNAHLSEQFDVEFDGVRVAILEMGALVKNQVSDVIVSLINNNVALMARVTDSHHRINTMGARINEACAQVIACCQPSANDLRFVISVAKTITELDYISNEAEKIARMARTLTLDHGLSFLRHSSVEHASETALDMLRRSLEASACLDIILAGYRRHVRSSFGEHTRKTPNMSQAYSRGSAHNMALN